MAHSRFALRLPEGDPSYNLSVTFGDTSPCRRGLGITQTSSLRQWLPYQGSCRAVGETERLYYITRFRSALRFPGGYPSYNLSVTCGDTSPCRRGLGITQTSPLCQRLPYQGSWREAPERLYYMQVVPHAAFYFPHTITYYTPPVPQTDRLHPRSSRGYNK